MKLQHLFSIFPGIPENAFSHLEVSDICSDARKVIPGSVFVAIRGSKADGHNFIPDAVLQGAAALVVEERDKVPQSFKGFVLEVPNSRQALDILASRFYWDPGRDLFCIGVTGTNGKTSITYMIECIFQHANMSTGVIGTVNHRLGGKVWPTDMTTPDAINLQKRLYEFHKEGASAVAIEVSSHALEQKRVDSVPFNAVVFTNLTRDHLDYHRTMEEYFQAKQRLFSDLLWKTRKTPCFAIVNTDDRWGRQLRVADPAILWTYGHREGDFQYEILKMDFANTHFRIQTPAGDGEILLPMSGTHNVMNALASIAVAIAAGISLQTAIKALCQFKGVPGRLQNVPNNRSLSVFIDYAHSPDALENVLTALNRVRESLKSKAKIWIVFGCGGDRDKGKRPLMTQVALKYADHVILTSDNPRNEDPMAIIKDMTNELPAGEQYRIRIEVQRKEAIRLAIESSNPGDVVLIAGKGHEDYQIIGGEKTPFSDFQVAEELMK
ncbi:MAG: UDP-N-acetylmuramoyl-L-alanyl-D-glutamate--2,6-diaminopimelate ligase [Bdellovibrionaceae bacterium]|nr:UDP-N-acetylmuramoyl-L-alanyl-D-glutamate--2,6-diaminopimelate ligase [Pseudobdellovibrionaceae bacterium]